MLPIHKIVVDCKNTLGSDILPAIAVKQVREYDSKGNKTDKIQGIAVVCLAEKLNFEKITVKVPDVFALPFEIPEEEVVNVKFTDLTAKLYSAQNGVGISFTAKSVELAPSK